MKTRLLLIFFLAALTGVTAQKKEKIKGNREVVTKIYTLKPFHAIELGEDLHVLIKPAIDTVALELRADENLHEVLEWHVSEGVLYLNTTKEIIKKKAFDITLFVQKDLKGIKLFQSARVKTDGKLLFNSLTVETDEFAKADLALQLQDTLQLRMKGKSKIELDAGAPVHLYQMTDNARLKGVIDGKVLRFTADKSAQAELGGGMKEINVELVDKAEFNSGKLSAKKSALVRLADKTDAALKGEGAGIEMHLSGKAHLHLSGDFKKYDLKTFTGNSSLTREP